MEKFKQIFKGFLKPKFNEDDLNSLTEICKRGNLKALDNLLNVKRIKITSLIKPVLKLAFENACEKGHLNIVEYLLTSPNTKKSFHNIHIESDFWVRDTCINRKNNIIKFLLSSPKLENHADIFVNKVFILACNTLNFDLIKFCTSALELKKHTKLYLESDEAFLSVCNDYMNALSVRDRDPNHLTISMIFKLGLAATKPYSDLNMIQGIIEYFILDLNIPKTTIIENFLNNSNQKYLSTKDEIAYKNIIKKIFDVRDLREHLKDGNQDNSIAKTPKRMKL